MSHRSYDPARDHAAAHRIWREVGWVGLDDTEPLDSFLTCSRALVADVAGGAECLVLSVPGDIQHLNERLSFFSIIAVTTSRIARKQGLAGRLTAASVAAGAAEGGLVAGLGMFEQGYYNQLGFGTGAYRHKVTFEPARLTVTQRARVPRRLTAEDWETVHSSRLGRRRAHGSCSLTPAQFTRGYMNWGRQQFGLGYYDDAGELLTHHLWFTGASGEHGPYHVRWLAYRSPEELLELLALIKGLGDQVFAVTMSEPAGLQLQDLVRGPFRSREIGRGGAYRTGIETYAWYQLRICDLPGCLARTHLSRGELRFNLRLSDPIERFLDDEAPWRGVAGDYVVTLGKDCAAEPGTDATLPALTASVNAFTRLWLGVRPATGLAVTDELSAPPALLGDLDEVLRLPAVNQDWDF